MLVAVRTFQEYTFFAVVERRCTIVRKASAEVKPRQQSRKRIKFPLPPTVKVTSVAVTRIAIKGDRVGGCDLKIVEIRKQAGRTCYTYTNGDCDILHEAAGGGKAHYGEGDSCELCTEADGSITFISHMRTS